MFSFVYDCGGTNKDTIDNAVDCFLDSIRDRKIDLLVLSHLHEDHINGIEKILGRLKPDGKIVMPYLDRDLELLYLYQSFLSFRILLNSATSATTSITPTMKVALPGTIPLLASSGRE